VKCRVLVIEAGFDDVVFPWLVRHNNPDRPSSGNNPGNCTAHNSSVREESRPPSALS
jgi:hypothetical protein